MQHGELPQQAAAEAAAAEAAAAEAPAAASPAAAAAAAGTPLQRRERRRPRDDEGGTDEPPPPVVFHDAVTLRQEADRPMLENILHFHRLPPQQVQQAQQARQAQQAPRWRSDRPLSDAEREFVGAVIEHRRERLLHKIDDKVPIPYGVVVPARFRPRDSAGFALKRPYKTRNGMPHNLGRQFFSNFKSEDESGFVWADGTEAFSAAAGERFLDWAEDTGAAALLVHPGGVEVMNMFGPDF